MDVPEALQQLLPSLPRRVLLELLLLGVCVRCIFRFLRVQSSLYSTFLPTPAALLAELSSPNKTVQNGGLGPEGSPCSVCLGVLQNPDHSNGDSESKDSAVGAGTTQSAAECILEALRREGHSFDSFALDISLPPMTLVRERALWCHLKENYKEEPLFRDPDVNELVMSLKDAVKRSLIERLEHLLSVKFEASSTFRICLTYKHVGSDADLDFAAGTVQSDAKRRRQGRQAGQDGSSSREGCQEGSAARSTGEAGESLASVQRTLASMDDNSFRRRYQCPPSKVDKPCQVTATCWRTSIYVGGRYLKLSRTISQSRWLIDEERRGDGSVQEIIGDVVFPRHQGDSYKFHAAGREDIDVRMLGDGRPFIIEILNARVIPTASDMMMAEEEINAQKEGWVKVRGLRKVGSEVCALMREGETDKQKEYAAVVWLSRPVTQADFECLSGMKGLELQQKTPIRVLHRRSPLTRPRIIHWMRCEHVEGSENYFLLHLCTQAGTYVKEFVHGDLGRTHPNLGSLLGCTADILQLDVTNVKMDFE